MPRGRVSKRPGLEGESALFSTYRYQAQIRKHSFNLTFLQFLSLIRLPCAYCGSFPDERKHGRYTYNANGVDRVDNLIGYELDNCVPCCTLCNLMKKTLTAETFIQHCNKISEHNA